MTGVENSGKPVFHLKLLVDKKKNKVVLAEACKEFVDVLFSFLTLPMGTIVRLLEKYQKIGCFDNIYRSVIGIDTFSFMKKACQDMLLYPRRVNDYQRKHFKLKLNIDDTKPLKYYTCSGYNHHLPSVFYSNFCSTKCICGKLMTIGCKWNLSVSEEEIFISHKPLFTITDNLKVGFSSTSHIMKTIIDSGYYDVGQLQEIHVDVDHEKVLALLQCLFSSDTPFSDVFLSEKRSHIIPKVLNMTNLSVKEEYGSGAQSNQVISVRLFTRKLDKKVVHIESEKDFVDLLFTFLVLPMDYASKLAGRHLVPGCIDNLCESFDSLKSVEGINASNNKCLLPCYYRCQQPLLDICYEEYKDTEGTLNDDNLVTRKPMDPTSDKLLDTGVCSGFVKRDKTFIISDDLTITPVDLSSTICSLKKWNMDLDDIEEHAINISKAEALKLLRASFQTSNALNSVFQSLLSKKPKEEKI